MSTTKKTKKRVVKKKIVRRTSSSSAVGSSYIVTEFDPDQIEAKDRIRTDMGNLAELASSIAQVGQIHPIRVVKNGKRKPTLVAGYRRMMACRQLKIKVRAEVFAPGDAYLASLRQIHENTKRKNFDRLEEGEALQRSKAEYEELHPETRKGAVGRRGSGRRASVVDKSSVATSTKPAPRYTLEASKALGCSERTVHELLELAHLPRAYKKMIEQAGTTAERNREANECLKKVRVDRKEAALKAEIAAKSQRTKNVKDKPLCVLHFGDNEDFMKGEELFEVCLTDPPYEKERSLISFAARASINPKQHKWDKSDVGWVLRIAPLLTKGGHLLVICPLEAIGTYELVCQAAGLQYRQALVWANSNPTSSHRSPYVSAAEAIVWATKAGGRVYLEQEAAKAGALRTNVLSGPGVPRKDRIHESQKPEWLIEQLLRTHACKQLEHRVIDPFAGSCTTGIVAKRLGLPCTLIEKDEDVVRKAKLRLKTRD